MPTVLDTLVDNLAHAAKEPPPRKQAGTRVSMIDSWLGQLIKEAAEDARRKRQSDAEVGESQKAHNESMEDRHIWY